MTIPGLFNCLIIRTEGYTGQEMQYICDVYHKYGKVAMYEYFKIKKILPFAAKSLAKLDLDSDFWLPILNEYRERNNKVLKFLDTAYAAMKAKGVKKVFLSENFGALLSADCDIGLFASGDTDNCYAMEEKDKIYEALTSIGCICKEIYALHRLNSSSWYPPKEFDLPEKFYMSLQPKPLSRLYLPSFVNMEDFDGWRDVYNYKDTHIQLANPTALMYICMLHISLHSYSRAPDIRLYRDLLDMSKVCVDYNKIQQWCEKNKTMVRVSVASTLSNVLMKTNFPISITNQAKRKDSVLNLVYDSSSNDLIYEPHGLKVLNIETRCDDKSILHGLNNILFPDKDWMNQTYGRNDAFSHIKHILRIL